MVYKKVALNEVINVTTDYAREYSGRYMIYSFQVLEIFLELPIIVGPYDVCR